MPPPVVGLLGPTNTGKTFLALERMQEHATGMVGFPLRLLARENYDRLARARGADAVALVTGEERIVPPHPRYWVCTVEAMPTDLEVDFLAVDEVQLAADRERGHVFTDRILHARGREETMLLGSDTMRPLLRRMVPRLELVSRPRLSTLRHVPARRLERTPRRSALVVFSLPELYAVAERLRGETGGAALVFGALSPRTRNAQVEMYQAGEVDHLVATDAIGMGLNLDLDHVAFTALVKHDGVGPRRLKPAEVGQIAGRAGRHVRDGTFGATTDLGELPPELVSAVEEHRFEPVVSAQWRNPRLSFQSIDALLESLNRRPPQPWLIRARHADDQQALETLRRDPEVAALARRPEDVRLLWDVCQVPDFRNVMTEAHTRLLAQLFGLLVRGDAGLPADWVDRQVRRLDDVLGDTHALLERIAAIRTWTYVSHRPGWLADAATWQARTRQIEDRLSDALHERLREEFVTRGASVAVRVAADGLVSGIAADGTVEVQGVPAARPWASASNRCPASRRGRCALPPIAPPARASTRTSRNWSRLRRKRSRWPPRAPCCGVGKPSAGCCRASGCCRRWSRRWPPTCSTRRAASGFGGGSRAGSRATCAGPWAHCSRRSTHRSSQPPAASCTRSPRAWAPRRAAACAARSMPCPGATASNSPSSA
ncbi:MAG: hypothetical protein KJ067_06915 [Vicinamibacteria bacterium]|nr:hypothetical protein [Vicinamibacteria bacterium]